jgi:DNA-binding NtrC family response regulator
MVKNDQVRNTKKKSSILLVERDEGLANLLEVILKNYQVTSVQNTVYGLSWIFEGNLPDVIILDVNALDISNMFFEGMQSNYFTKDIPIILLNEEEDFNKFDYHSAWNIKVSLDKPFSPHQLQTILQELLIGVTL